MPAIPRALTARLARNHPEARTWLLGLPRAVGEVAAAWNISVGDLLPGSSAGTCFACDAADGAAAVLKLGPSPLTVMREAAALSIWESAGGVAVLGVDPERGALLMSRAQPAAPLTVGDVAALIGRLHVRADAGMSQTFPSLETEVAFRLQRARRLHRNQVQTASSELNLTTARRVAKRLLADAGPDTAVLLHGDLLDRNVVAMDGVAAAIDPRPCIGDAAYDVAMWGLTHDPAGGVVERVVALAEATAVDPGRAVSWAWFLAALRAVTAAPGEQPVYHDLLRADGMREGALR